MTNPFDPRSGFPQGPAQQQPFAPTQNYPEQGYRAPPAGPWGVSASAFQAAYAPATQVPSAATNSIYGDGAGEYLRISRGRYSGWPHVVIAFLYQVGLLAALIGFPIAFLVAAITNDSDLVWMIPGGIGVVGGVVGAFFMFRDRWKCIEAFASRYCIGMVRISAMYVPVVALVYANVRAFQKLAGK